MPLLLFLCFFTFLPAAVCRAQYLPLGAVTQWTDGYVVTNQNDTIRGELRVGSFVNDSPAGAIFRLADGQKQKIKSEDLRVIAQRLPTFAYATGSIPPERSMIVFERVPNPRRGGRPMLLERLTPPGGRLALYFDAAGWKKTTTYSFGSFSVSDRQDLSYIVVKDGTESLVVKRGDLETQYTRLFGDCPAFTRQYPAASRQNWDRFGEWVAAYNDACSYAGGPYPGSPYPGKL